MRALKANMSDEQTRFSILNGFRPEIRQVVLQHDLTNLADIRKWATVAEASVVETDSNSVVLAMKRLEEKFDKLQACGMDSQTESRARSKSPRVTFQDRGESSNRGTGQGGNSAGNRGWSGSNWRQGSSSEGYGQGGRQGRGWNRGRYGWNNGGGITRDAPGGIIGVVRVLGLKHSISPNKVMICVISVVYDGTLTITVIVKLVLLLVLNVG